MRVRDGLGLALCWMMVAGTAYGTDKVTLVRNGHSEATIVVAKQATRAAQLAVLELQEHIRLITGVTLPVVDEKAAVTGTRILVGESAATRKLGLRTADFESQEYLVRCKPDTLILMGCDKADLGKVAYWDLWDENYNPADKPAIDEKGCAHYTFPGLYDERGTLNAVYDFLENHCGVRWYRPGPVGLSVEPRKTLAVEVVDKRRSPGMHWVEIGLGVHSQGYEALSDFWHLDARDKKSSDECERLAWEPLQKRCREKSGNYTEARRREGDLFLLRRRCGGEPYSACHSFDSYYLRFWEKRTEPEYAKLWVERRPSYFGWCSEGLPPQLCYTCPDVLKQELEDADNFFDKGITLPWQNSKGDYFAVVPMDNSSYCRCPRCQAFLNKDEAGNAQFSNGMWSDYVFNFANEVAKGLQQKHPGKYVSALAYSAYAYHPRFRLEDNIAVQMCLHVRNWWVPAMEKNDVKMFKSWAESEKGRRLFLWLYYCFPTDNAAAGGWKCFPGFFAHDIGRQIKMFHEGGARGVFFNGWGQDFDAYLTLKLFEDPSATVEQVIDDYYTRYYGAAAEPMKQLYLAIEETYSNPMNYPEKIRNSLGMHQTQQIAWGILGTPERMAKFAVLMDQAKAAARTDIEKQRVAIFEAETWKYMQAGRKQFEDRMALPVPKVTAAKVSSVQGDSAKVDWSRATPLGDWFKHGSSDPADRKLQGQMAHDGTFLYVRLVDPCDVGKLVVSAGVACYDDWEVFFAGERALPYRQLLLGPTAMMVGYSHGEVNYRMCYPWLDHGAVAVSDTKTVAGKWVLSFSIPLKNLTPAGVKPGDKFYVNIVRVTGPAITGGAIGVESWLPVAGTHEPDRLGEITLGQ